LELPTPPEQSAAGALNDDVANFLRQAFTPQLRYSGGSGGTCDQVGLRARQPREQGQYGQRKNPSAKICHFLLLVSLTNVESVEVLS